MAAVSLPEPVFPGGRDTAPEAVVSTCANPACFCHVEPGRRFCSLACARARDDDSTCHCADSPCRARL